MSGGIYDTSVLPDIVNAGSSVVSGIGEGAGWLKQQFDQTSPRTQQIIMGIVGLIGGAMAGNLAAWGTGTQGTWAGTGMKWAMAIAAMAVLSSDANPFKAPINGEATPGNRDAVVTAETDPRNPWRDTNNDGTPDTFTPTREMRPALPGPG
jgi:hypothetical protein